MEENKQPTDIFLWANTFVSKVRNAKQWNQQDIQPNKKSQYAANFNEYPVFINPKQKWRQDAKNNDGLL